MALLYPPTGFHFLVRFDLFPAPADTRFQSVAGLSVETEFEEVAEGGQRQYKHQLPVRTKHGDLILKRGMHIGSTLTEWFNDAFENFTYKPTNLEVILLNELHSPLRAWRIEHALPKKLEVSSFNAESSELVIETLTLTYHYIKVINELP
jgi:phage tail-like protein